MIFFVDTVIGIVSYQLEKNFDEFVQRVLVILGKLVHDVEHDLSIGVEEVFIIIQTEIHDDLFELSLLRGDLLDGGEIDFLI